MEDDDIETWVLRMSAEALLRARAFVCECKERGLHEYDEAQIRLEASETLEDVLLWAQVWEYVQARTYAGWNDRILIDFCV